MLDKNKTKELEWAEEYRKLLKEYQVNAEDWDCFPDLGVKFINDLLTQQRTELEQQKVKVVWNDVCEQIKKDTIEQILNLECLKEEFVKERWLSGSEEIPKEVFRNQIRKEIKEEITKDLFKDFKQVSNPLDEDYE